jgi:hypothetical protein
MTRIHTGGPGALRKRLPQKPWGRRSGHVRAGMQPPEGHTIGASPNCMAQTGRFVVVVAFWRRRLKGVTGNEING